MLHKTHSSGFFFCNTFTHEEPSVWNLNLKACLFLHCRNYSKVLTSEVSSPTRSSGKFDLPQEVLESLFNISKSPEHEPNTMNWRNVVKKLQSVGPRFDVCPSGVTESQQELCGIEYISMMLYLCKMFVMALSFFTNLFACIMDNYYSAVAVALLFFSLEYVAKGDEYQVYRKDAKQHWDSMKSSYQKVWQIYCFLQDFGDVMIPYSSS